MLLHGDCLEQLKTLETNSVDALVTDPPAGISFMGKDWDKDKGGREQWIAWMSEVTSECLRVLKPGAHGLVWAIPRTSHWTATALENAGFEIRDVVTHLFGSGFPKSLDISKAIDKAAGAKREIIGTRRHDYADSTRWGETKNESSDGYFQSEDKNTNLSAIPITAPATPEAKQWQGFGTALKPASEHWILVRKPISEKTVAANVLKHGCGGINIDASRISYANAKDFEKRQKEENSRTHKPTIGFGLPDDKSGSNVNPLTTQGRFPANLLLSHTLFCEDECTEDCPVRLLDEQSGVLKSGALLPGHKQSSGTGNSIQTYGGQSRIIQKPYGGDTGGASRFFYVAKASKRERNAGLEGMPEGAPNLGGSSAHGNHNPSCLVCKKSKFDRGNGLCMCTEPNWKAPTNAGNQNFHPTVKPQKLMQYLITLITPPGGTVLDPFLGSGSTGVAAKSLGFNFIGIEKEQEYFEIAEKRINAV